MSIDDFDNETNLLARRRWSERLLELVSDAAQRLPIDLAGGAQAREFGLPDPFSKMPEVAFKGLQSARADPETTFRTLLAYQRAAHRIIVEMMRAHWEATGATLAPPR